MAKMRNNKTLNARKYSINTALRKICTITFNSFCILIGHVPYLSVRLQNIDKGYKLNYFWCRLGNRHSKQEYCL